MSDAAPQPVGIRELKARLSECVARASGGEEIVVTDRGRPVARLVALDGQQMIERGISEGWLAPATRSSLDPPVRYSTRSSIAEVLDEDRE